MPQFPHWAKGRRQGKEVSPKAFLLRLSMIPGAHDGPSQPGPDLRASAVSGLRPQDMGQAPRTTGLRSGSAVGSREAICGYERVPQPAWISPAPGSRAPVPSPRALQGPHRDEQLQLRNSKPAPAWSEGQTHSCPKHPGRTPRP